MLDYFESRLLFAIYKREKMSLSQIGSLFHRTLSKDRKVALANLIKQGLIVEKGILIENSRKASRIYLITQEGISKASELDEI
ncbi:MAG: hypothetical protein ACJA0H_000495 [Francisellaceae bacterium]|jgi:hypothetical protein